jgi:ankyrin repeat protein
MSNPRITGAKMSQDLARAIECRESYEKMNDLTRTPLHDATMLDRAAKTQTVDVETQTVDGLGACTPEHAAMGHTPLHLAALHGHFDLAQLLIQADAEVNAAAALNADTPLHMASKRGRPKLAQMLVEAGANVHAKRIGGETPLHDAAMCDSVDVAQILVEAGATVDAQSRFPGTPLHVAAEAGSLRVARFLVQAGASVSTFCQCGFTPLHVAVRHGHLDLARMLVSAGADAEVRSRKEHWNLRVTSLDLAAVCVHDGGQMAKLLVTEIAQKDAERARSAVTTVMLNVLMRHFDNDRTCAIVRSLIHLGADVHARRRFRSWSFTPLHYAALSGELEIVKLLVGCGADLFARVEVCVDAAIIDVWLGRQYALDSACSGLIAEEVAKANFAGGSKAQGSAIVELLRDTRIARCTAFAMTQHRRLGASSHLQSFDDELMRIIWGYVQQPPGQQP